MTDEKNKILKYKELDLKIGTLSLENIQIVRQEKAEK